MLARMAQPPPASAPGRGDRPVALWLAVVAALAYLPFSHCHFMGSDETGVFLPARALYTDGSMAISPGQHIFEGRDGRHYSHFAIGQTLLALPFVAVGESLSRLVPEHALRRVIGRDFQGFIDTQEGPAIFLVSAYAPLVSGLLVALFFLFERGLGASRRAALFSAALLGACTYVATHSVYFLRHTTEALAILGAFAAFHAYRRSGGVRWLALGSLAASAIVLVRVPAAIAGPALLGYLLYVLARRRPRESALRIALAVGLPALAVAAVHLGVNQARWGTWIESPMLSQTQLFQGSYARGLHGLLASPGASVFVYSPLLLLLPLTLPGFWRAHRAECLTLLALSVSFLLLCGKFVFWHGLWSAPGPRYLFALTPLLMLPLGPWLDAARGWQRAWVAALGVAGLAAQLLLMTTHWRRTVELMAYHPEISHVGFLFEPLRAPLVGCARALWAGEVDVYLFALWQGVPGRAPAPTAALALGAVWVSLLAISAQRLRAAIDAPRTL